METPAVISVVVAARPYLLASALTDMLEMRGVHVRLVDPAADRPQEHACVALVDASTLHAAEATSTVWIPASWDRGSTVVSVGGSRFAVPVGRPSELVELVVAVAAKAGCCTPMPAAALRVAQRE
jgi:hypothetical protein